MASVSQSERIERAIAETQPTGEGQRNRQLFKLARALKAMPQLADSPTAELRPIVLEWFRRALPRITTKEWGTTWGDFANAWANVRYPEGTGTMARAMAAAKLATPPEWSSAYGPAQRFLASLCRELQRVAGDAPFHLSVRVAGRLAGVNPTTAQSWLRAFQADGALLEVERGKPGCMRATRWRYVKPMESEQ